MSGKGRSKGLIVIGVIIFIAILIGSYMAFLKGGGEGWSEVSGGPTTNVQSLTSGQAMAFPQEKGLSAGYGYYLGGSRVGGTTITFVEETNYQGTASRNLEGSFNSELSMQETSVKFSGDMEMYIEKDSGRPEHLSYAFHYTEPSQGDLNMDFTWYENQSKMVTKLSGMGMSETVTASFPPKYWNDITFEELHVGYSKQITYEVEGESVSLSIDVIEHKDVTVPKGTYENCYLVSISQTGLNQSNQEIEYWINEEGVVPKMSFNQTIGTTSFTLVTKLEHYGYKP